MDRRSLFGMMLGSALLPTAARAEESCSGPFADGFLRCETGIPSFQFVSARQSESQWCWAACIEMVAGYYGHNLSQETIVQTVYGRLVNLPAVNWTIINALNRTWIDDDGNEMQTACDIVWDAQSGIMRPDAPQVASQYLLNNQPLIVGTLGHAMVLTAVGFVRSAFNPYLGEATHAVVRDPWPGRSPRRLLSPQEWHSIQFLIAPRVF